jgi:hypothetical protein
MEYLPDLAISVTVARRSLFFAHACSCALVLSFAQCMSYEIQYIGLQLAT